MPINNPMQPIASRRAVGTLLAFLTAPSCRFAQHTVRQRAAQSFQQRCISSATRRFQQPAAIPSPAPDPDQAVVNTRASSNALSPSTEKDSLRNLETVPEPRSLTDQLSDPPPFLGEDEKQVDWTRSYHGLSSSPFTAEQAAILQQKIEFDDIEIKPDGIIYLPEIKYRRILNRAFGPGGWGLAPRGETIVTGKLVTREYGLVCGGRYAILNLNTSSRFLMPHRLVSIARGEQQYFDADGIPTATEGCKSNALMRCCKDLGIASELWDPRFIRKFMAEMGKEMIVEHVTTKKRRKHYMRKDDELKYPFKEVSAPGQQTGGGYSNAGGVKR